MRPIQKQACPNVGGVDKSVTDYHFWKLDLENAIGMFCSYCGMRLTNSPQVEHVVPQNPMTGNPSGNPLAWHNVVFSCSPCNGANGKSNKYYNEVQHYMPEKHNTLLPFKYTLSATLGHITIEIADGLLPSQQTKASDTIGLFNFQNIDTRENKFDFRSSERWQAKKTADATYEIYKMAKVSPSFNVGSASSYVAIQSVSSGFFQLWVEVFINEPEVLKKLIHQDFHPGTHQQSFNAVTGKPCNRNPLNITDPI
jgi:hypothetical protein